MEATNMTIRSSVLTAAAMTMLSLPVSAEKLKITTASGVGNSQNPAVAPVQSNVHGGSYEEWAARFWQWEFSLPVNASPIFDTAGCAAGQTGKVWFLGGSALPFEVTPGVFKAVANRVCVVPPGTSLFFPIVNNECSTVPGDVLPIPGGYSPTPTDAELRACARYASSFIVPATLSATLDGVPIQALSLYQVTSPAFTFGPLPGNNVLEYFGLPAPAGTMARSVADGIHLMLHPLATGNHTLHFYSELDLGTIGGPMFIQDITNDLTVGHGVQPDPRFAARLRSGGLSARHPAADPH
jgi:hypothetical protein